MNSSNDKDFQYWYPGKVKKTPLVDKLFKGMFWVAVWTAFISMCIFAGIGIMEFIRIYN